VACGSILAYEIAAQELWPFDCGFSVNGGEKEVFGFSRHKAPQEK